MRFTPKTDEEISAENLLPPGEYDYEVMEASEGVSSKGNDMIKLKLRIFHGETERHVYDYLLEAMPGKLKHFCDSHGLQQRYTDGTLRAQECDERQGRCRIGVQKDKKGQFPDKNQILDYISLVSMPRGSGPQAVDGPPPFAPVADDDCPL